MEKNHALYTDVFCMLVRAKTTKSFQGLARCLTQPGRMEVLGGSQNQGSSGWVDSHANANAWWLGQQRQKPECRLNEINV